LFYVRSGTFFFPTCNKFLMKRFLLLGALLWSYTATAQLSLLKDICHMFDGGTSGLMPEQIVDVNNTLFFSSSNRYGNELWKSDGTLEGTVLVKDIYPGLQSSYPSDFVKMNGEVYFLASDGIHGKELWKSDGTEEGTYMVLDVSPGYVGTEFNSQIWGLKVCNNILYFVNRTTSYDLWASDGTSDGTLMIYPNFMESKSVDFEMVKFNGAVYFVFSDNKGSKLIRTNGTVETTTTVMQFPLPYDVRPRNLTVYKDAIFYTQSSVENGEELWRTDGTTAVMIKDIRTGRAGSYPSDLRILGDQLIFHANDGTSAALWKTDGTSIGTVKLKALPAFSSSVAVTNNVIFFIVPVKLSMVSSDDELWRTDGTVDGTFAVKRFGSILNLSPRFTAMNESVYFAAVLSGNESTDFQLWRSNGQPDGTKQLTNFQYDNGINPQNVHRPHGMTASNGQLFFCSSTSNEGSELWKTNGTEIGTIMVSNIPQANYGSDAQGFTKLNSDMLIFTAGDEFGGLEPWRTDGTAGGTFMLHDVLAGGPPENSSQASGYTLFRGYVYFAASSHTTGRELWRTDGTKEGTMLFRDMNSSAGSRPKNLTVFGNVLLFSANGDELWRTDGTLTEKLTDIFAGSLAVDLQNFVLFNNAVYFSAANTLWKTDGTPAGTIQIIKTIGNIAGLVSMGDKLLFTSNSELWVSDGMSAGTHSIRAFGGIGDLSNYSAQTISGWLFFKAKETSNILKPFKLWKTNGTATGTTKVNDIDVGQDIVAVKNNIYFSGTTDELGNELWKTDGTADGSFLVKDIAPGKYHSNLKGFIVVGDYVYFNAYDLQSRTLWKTNGKQCGTVKVVNNDVWVDTDELVLFNDTIFTTGFHQSVGKEIYLHDVNKDINVPVECRVSQTILFSEIDEKEVGQNDFSLEAEASSGLIVQYRAVSDNIAISGHSVVIKKAGVAIVEANQSGNANYEAAQSVQRSFCVSPKKPVITSQVIDGGVFLTSSNPEGNLWFKNEVLIDAASDSSLLVKESGVYTVRTEIEGCQSAFSDPASITVTAIENGKSAHQFISIYPNPAREKIQVHTAVDNSVKEVKILGRNGVELLSENDIDKGVDIHTLPVGLYIIQIITLKGIFNCKLVKE
jgi:ELWxxDGT repeat protein